MDEPSTRSMSRAWPRRLCAVLLAAVVTGGTTLAAGDGPVVVGHVLEIEGEGPDDFAWRRDGEPVEMALYAAVEEGDTIEVKSPKAKCRLLIAEREVEVVAEKPFRAQGEGRVPDRLSNIFASLVSLLSPEPESESTTATMVRAIRPLDMPLLVPDQPSVVAGDRPLYLGWTGGDPPFSVALLAILPEGQPQELLRAETSDRALRWDGPLAPGDYVLEITDAQGAWLEGTFVAVPAEQRFAGCSAVAGASPLADWMTAACLAGAGDGGWALEAYQVLRARASSYPPAGALADALQHGTRTWRRRASSSSGS